MKRRFGSHYLQLKDRNCREILIGSMSTVGYPVLNIIICSDHNEKSIILLQHYNTHL